MKTPAELAAELAQLGDQAVDIEAQLKKAEREIKSADPRFRVPGTDHSIPVAWYCDPGYGALWGTKPSRVMAFASGLAVWINGSDQVITWLNANWFAWA